MAAPVIVCVVLPEEIRAFYEDAYRPRAGDGEDERRWRELGAVGKADHVMTLAAIAAVTPATMLEVGCGDGAVSAELGRRGFGGRRSGIDVSATAVAIAAARPELAVAERYDGERIAAADDSYDLVFATHVLEHVTDPGALVAELRRVARLALIVEVPLERNLAARRPAARALSRSAGHIQCFDRHSVRQLAAVGGWRIAGELLDPLPAAVHLHGRSGVRARAIGQMKSIVRHGLALAPALATRLFTLHYALVTVPDPGPG